MRMAHVTNVARIDFRNDNRIIFGIKDDDRFSHIYVIGKTGTGKSTLLETMALQDIERGRGLAVIDPHGDLVERIAARVPQSGRDDVIYFNAADPTQPYGYNPLRQVRAEFRTLAASGLMEVFKKMWADSWGVRMEHILRNVLLALLEQPDATLHDILRMFSDKEYRKGVAGRSRTGQCGPSSKWNSSAFRSATAPTVSHRSRTRSAPFSPIPFSIAL